MTTITFDELQKDLLDYVRRASEGETFRVKRSGRQSVELKPGDIATEEPRDLPPLTGLSQQLRPNPKEKYTRLEPLYEGTVSGRLLDLERGDR